jgi:hypothetical protein
LEAFRAEATARLRPNLNMTAEWRGGKKGQSATAVNRNKKGSEGMQR